MAEPERKKGPTVSGLLKTAIGSGAALTALGYRELKRQERQRPLGERLAKSRAKAAAKPKPMVSLGEPIVPKGKPSAPWRLASKAAKATRLGAIGTVASVPSMVAEAVEVEREGGDFSARLGKYVENLLGVPSGSTGRGMTDEEKRHALSL
jgi:hypothetical protein